MNSPQADLAALVGRIFLAVLFLTGGISQIGNLQGATAYATANGLPLANIAVIIGIVLQIGGALALILGFYTRLGAFALFLFTAAAIVFFHRFWEKTGQAAMMDQIQFFKDLALCGGFLVVMAFGPGRLSLDARRGR